MRNCSKCRKKLPLNNFYIKHILNGKTYYRSKCITCYNFITEEQLKIRKKKGKIYYQKNKKKISFYKKKLRADKTSVFYKYKNRGPKNWTNDVFDLMFQRYNKNFSIWHNKLMKIFQTNETYEMKRLNIIKTNELSNEQIYQNWKKRYSKIKVWQNRKELDYIFEFCYRRAMTAQTSKISNINKIHWEKRFDSLASIMRIRL